ncbi:exostosin family protein [uncultured Shimia sp.]|uniref:exostosin domain-containing protein n=1 Tax=uncultured Shimia sp. TaxID=573152 RepID=UPI0026100445|nr:exostosin family protein [uncultured Shimia sp.]
MPETLFITIPGNDDIKAIDRSILSIVTQTGNFSIRLHVHCRTPETEVVDRLKWWKRRLSSKGFPLQCVSIDISIGADVGSSTFRSVCQGLEAMSPARNQFVTWLQPGDILQPGCLSFVAKIASQMSPAQVSWISGAPSVLKDEVPVPDQSVSIDVPKAFLAAGLCDGIHWPRLQQAGTFFRRWLWESVDADNKIASMEWAGDWKLWSLFAAKASLVQSPVAFAARTLNDDDTEASVESEINESLPQTLRAEILEDLAKPDAEFLCRQVKELEGEDVLQVLERGCNAAVSSGLSQILKAKPNIRKNSAQPRIVATGTSPEAVEEVPLEDFVSFDNNIAAYDRDWQFPAITEQHAFTQLKNVGSIPETVTYVAYPWANLIDKIQTHAKDSELHLSLFRKFVDGLPQGTVRVTTCQHIKLRNFLYLFEQAGISHIFWSHATTRETVDQDTAGFDIHPFPLFPVQIPEADTILPISERPYLFSFIGAKSNQYYLTQAREWILNELKDHPRGLIIGRDTWHYNKVVYEHQIKPEKKGGNAADLIDKSASEQFRISMVKSVFSLCPSGTGPNSIRLWETLGAGGIPVIMADSYAMPGDPALWEAGVVFCKEDRESIKELPARLIELAKDTHKLEAMRKVCAQLWLLYGPDSFVYDVHKFMLTLGHQAKVPGVDETTPSAAFRETLAETMSLSDKITDRQAQLLLRVCSSDLLLEGGGLLEEFKDDGTVLGQVLELAQEILPADNVTLQHYHGVASHFESQEHPPAVYTPSVVATSGPSICFFGNHSNRTPLSYPAFQQAVQGKFQIASDPTRADVIMTGYNVDFRENVEVYETISQNSPDTKFMVVSEEPLWDSLWSGGFSSQNRKAKCGDAEVDYVFLNHSNSEIYAFDKIPYFLLTNDDLLARYGLLIAPNCNLKPKELLDRWQNADISAAFIAERREGSKYTKNVPEHAVYTLSSYRSEIAAKTIGDNVLREGKGWHSDKPRQDLPDWHLDKLAALNGRVRVMSSFENTHQKDYISEKIVDAFVVGGIPTYFADKDHSIHKLVSPRCVINTFGKSADEGAKMISEVAPDLEMAEAWIETARYLRKTFTDHDAIVAERVRVAEAVLREVDKL